jgi:FlgD Ig-like domain
MLVGGTVVGSVGDVAFQPIFDGVIAEYTYTADDGATDFRELWGTDYSSIIEIEENLKHNNMRMYLPAGAATSLNGALSEAAWIPLEYVVRSESQKVQLTGATYDAGTNILAVGFNRTMQYDQIPEDIIGRHEYNPGWPAAGDGVVTPTRENEDRNENGIIDFEQNVNVAQIVLSDAMGGTVTLSSALDMTRMDSNSLELELLPSDRASVEELDGETMMISFIEYTFVDVNWNPAELTTDFPVGYTADSFPLEVVTSYYDMGLNLLTVQFNQPLGTRVSDYAVIPKLGFQRVEDDTTYTYALEAGVPGLTNSDSSLTVIMGVSTARATEDLIDVEPSGEFTLHVRSNAALSHLGNGNIPGTVPVEIIDEGSNKGPELDPDDPPYYNAETNELYMRFDVRLDGEVVFENIHFISGTDTVSLTDGEATRVGGNKAFSVILGLEDQYALENTIDTDNLRFVIEPYSIKQGSKLNGNRWIEVDPFTYMPDVNPPLIEYAWYDEVNGRLVIGSNGTVPVEGVDLTKLNLSGVSFSAPESTVLSEPNRISLYLSEGDVADMDGIVLEDRVALTIDAPAGFLTNGDGVEGVEIISTSDGDTLTNDADEVVLTLGFGREFIVRSQEAFPTIPRTLDASLREVSENALWYVANDQWNLPYQPYGIRDGKDVVHPIVTALRTEELDAAVDFFEVQTPKFENSGAQEAIVNLIAEGREDQFPDRVNILLADVWGEFGIGRNDSQASFWRHGYFLPSDLPGSEDEYSNQSDLIIIDSYPQSFTTGDEAWNWDTSNEEWDPFSMDDLDDAGFAALANVYAQYVAYKVDRFEEPWISLGLAYFCEFYTNDQPEFYGEGPARGILSANSLPFIGSDFKVRTDYKHAYMYILYLWEKYGGDDFITTLATSPRTGMSGVAEALELRKDFLEEWQQVVDIHDLFLDFATANLIDTSYSDDDNNRFMFENINTQGAIKGDALRWKASAGKDRAPYQANCEEWSFTYKFTGYAEAILNPVLNPTEDNLVIFAGENGTDLLFRKVNMQSNEVAANMSLLPILIQDAELDPELYRTQIPMSPDGEEGDWVFAPVDNPNTTILTWVMIAAGEGDYLIDHVSSPADYSELFVAQNPVVTNLIDLNIISERPLYRADGVAAPTVSVYADANKSELISRFESPDDFAQTSIENASGMFEQYTAQVTSSETGEMYWFLEGYYANGIPVLESDPTMVVMSVFEGGEPRVFKLDDGFQISATKHSFETDHRLLLVRSPEVAEVSAGTFNRASDRMDPVSPSYALGGRLEKLHDPIQLSLPFDTEAVSGSEIGLYLLRQGQWDYVGGEVNESKGTISTPVGYLGIYAVFAGPHGDIPADLAIPSNFELGQNYPNPFNPSTTVRIALPQKSPISLVVYDVLGREVARLFDGELSYGTHTFHFDGHSANGSPIASGVYFVRMDAAGFSSTRKMVMVK